MLTKSCELASKVVIEHFEISALLFDVKSGKVTAMCEGYLSAAAKAAGAKPVWMGKFLWNAGDNPELSASALSLAVAKLSSEIDAGKIK